MTYEIFRFTQGGMRGACALVGKGEHEGTLRHVPAEVLEEIVGIARREARAAGFKVKREQFLIDPDNIDGPEVQRTVAGRLDRMFQMAHAERLSRNGDAQGIETRSDETAQPVHPEG